MRSLALVVTAVAAAGMATLAHAGDTMTVSLEPRGMTLPGEQLAIPLATILQLHVSMGWPAGQSRFSLARVRGGGERWVEVKRPKDVRHERSGPSTQPPALPGTSRPGVPPGA